MAQTDRRPLEAYSIHGRTGDGVVDYPSFFARLADLERIDTQVQHRDEISAITAHSVVDGVHRLRFVSGLSGVEALYYDIGTGEETTEETGDRLVASTSWMIADPSRRLAAIERSRPGVSIAAIERTLGELAISTDSGRARFDLNPVPAKSFLTELDQLDRIRQAAVVLQRPNFNWADNAAELTEYTDDSNGDRVSLEISAPRGEGLETSRGIVADIKRLISNPISSLKTVKVKGQRADEERERTVGLQKHQERRYVTVPAGQIPGEVLDLAGRTFLAEIELPDPDE